MLGFSKGANQTRTIRERKPFDAIAFASSREKLAKILRAIGVPLGEQTIDQTMTARSDGLAYASLVRCSFELNGVTSGTIMSDAVNDEWAKGIMTRCILTHLASMPASVERTVLLGNTPAYMAGVRAIMRPIFADYADVNEVAFRANGRVWVFVCHPSAQGARVEQFVEHPASESAGRKRELAREAFGPMDTLASKSTSIGTKRLIKRAQT